MGFLKKVLGPPKTYYLLEVDPSDGLYKVLDKKKGSMGMNYIKNEYMRLSQAKPLLQPKQYMIAHGDDGLKHLEREFDIRDWNCFENRKRRGKRA